MARPALPIGQQGNIATKQLGPKRWESLCRIRDEDGVTRRVRAMGASRNMAINALGAKLKERNASSGVELTPESKVAELAEAWFSSLDKASGTMDAYRHTLDRHILPGLGARTIRETRTSHLDKFIRKVAEPALRTVTIKPGMTREMSVGGPSAAKMCRVVLSSMFSMAVRHDALLHNPVREVSAIPRSKAASNRALTVDEMQALRRRVLEWQNEDHMGPARSQDVIDRVDLFIATGVRPGELLALRWQDLNLTADIPTLEVTGTVRRSKGLGLHRQAYPKSESGERILQLPPFAVSMLRRRKMAEPPNDLDLVFTSRTGGLLEPNNFNRQWAQVRGEEFAWVTGKSFRKAVATMIKESADGGMGAAAAQLGHSSEDITRRYYVERDKNAPDLRVILEQFAGPTGT